MTAKTDKGVWVKSLDIQCRQRIMQSPSSDRHIERLAKKLGLEKTMRGGEKCYFVTLDKLDPCVGVKSFEELIFDSDDNLDHLSMLALSGGGQNHAKIDALTTQVEQLSDTSRTLSSDIDEKNEKIAKLKKQLEAAKNDAQVFESRYLTAAEQLRIAQDLLKSGQGNVGISQDVLNRITAVEDMNEQLVQLNNAMVKRVNDLQAMIESRPDSEAERDDLDDDDEDEDDFEVDDEVGSDSVVEPIRMSVFKRLRRS